MKQARILTPTSNSNWRSIRLLSQTWIFSSEIITDVGDIAILCQRTSISGIDIRIPNFGISNSSYNEPEPVESRPSGSIQVQKMIEIQERTGPRKFRLMSNLFCFVVGTIYRFHQQDRLHIEQYSMVYPSIQAFHPRVTLI